jgi:hypothetical protein
MAIEKNGSTHQKMFLFLTNSQARQYDFSHKSVDRLLAAMEIPKPSLVINLIGSWSGAEKTAHFGANCSYLKEWSTILSHHTHSETDGRGLQRTDQKLEDFLENTVLQMAIHTKALVLCSHTQCLISVAFNRVIENYQKRISGGKLPFSVMHMNTAANVHMSASTPGQVAQSLMRNSKRWTKHYDNIKAVVPKEVGLQQSADCPAYCTHYIIVDGVHATKKTKDRTAYLDFTNSLVQELSSELPSIAICSLHNSGDIEYVTDCKSAVATAVSSTYTSMYR